MTVENGLGNVLLRDVYYAMWYGDPIEYLEVQRPGWHIASSPSPLSLPLLCVCCSDIRTVIRISL